MSGADGFMALGDMLVGGPKRRAEDEYAGQYRKNAQAADSMWKARDMRARAIAREGLKPELFTQAGIPENQAPLAATILQAGDTPNLRNAALGDLGDMALDKEIRSRMEAGDFAGANQLTAVKADKNYEPVRVTGGNMMPSGVALGDEKFEVVPLPQTLATIEQKEAQIDQGQQRTNATVARANRPPAGRPSTPSDDKVVLAQARERVAGGADPKVVADYLRSKGYPDVAKKIHAGK